MSGTVIPLFTKRQFQFGNGSADFIAVKAVDVSQFTEGSILVRGHAVDLGTGSSVDVVAYTTAPSREEPSVDYDGASAVATATIPALAAAPYLAQGTLSSNFGGFLKIKVEGTKGAGACDVTLSADLVIKD